MERLITSKKLIISVISIIIVIAVPSSVYGYNNYNFNKLYNSGITLLDKEKFDDAINNFNSSLKYKPKMKKLIEGKINQAKDLKESKAVFDSAVALQNEKKYLDAIDSFQK